MHCSDRSWSPELSQRESNCLAGTHACCLAPDSSVTNPKIGYLRNAGTSSPRITIEAISQASADQRKGRCGRIGPGICIRLFSEDDFSVRDRFTSPEIQRTNLAAVILQTLAFDLGPLDEFPLLDPPRPEAIRDGYKTLAEIGAIDEQRNLTPIGRTLARLPVDPRIGRMIIAADQEHCLADVLVMLWEGATIRMQIDRSLRPVDDFLAFVFDSLLDERS